MAIIQGSAKSSARGFYPLTIEQSLRFNDDDSAYLSRTPASAGNRKTWTWSGWVKRGNISGSAHFPLLFAGTSTNNDAFQFRYTSDEGELFWRQEVSSLAVGVENSLATFRDPSSWYHIVFVYDSGNATSTDRIKIYVNGSRIDLDNANLTELNRDSNINNAVSHYIGRSSETASYFDGYLAEVHFCDGTAYDADAFGEFKSGVWVAKSPSVTYGTNGFHLDFANSADIGNDVSGEGNDWTPNNFTASDVVLDSPTDNFATLNPLAPYSFTLADGNLSYTTGNSSNPVIGTIVLPETGKYYWEVNITNVNEAMVGIQTLDNLIYAGPKTVYYRQGGASSSIFIEGTADAYDASSYTDSDVIAVAFNADDSEISWYKNNVQQGGPYTLTSLKNLIPIIYQASGAGATSGIVNFGQLGFTYTPPTGYLALSTANLPDPVIDPAQDASPSDYFNTVLYTGNNSTTQSINVGLVPDLVWIKSRTSGTGHHSLIDRVRGDVALNSNQTIAEYGVTAFNMNTDGTIDVPYYASDYSMNTSANSYVAWNWKANGSGVTNTDGSITSTVSANTTSGFSIVTYSGNGVGGATVGHGLTQAPDVIIVKNRVENTATGSGTNWRVYHSANTSAPETEILTLSSTNGTTDDNRFWNDTAPTSSVFTLGTHVSVNASVSGGTATYVAYCFHSVEGFSKFGSYVGNGSADGPFVYTGFRPAFIIAKKSDGAENWIMLDSERSQYNLVDKQLLPNTSGAEGTISRCDFLSNGFKVRASSTAFNSGTMIYMAFAENPFKYSNAR